VSPTSIATRAGATGLAALAGVHVVWATGSPWPLEDRAALADAVIGRSGNDRRLSGSR
jgi:hypothetical protein